MEPNRVMGCLVKCKNFKVGVEFYLHWVLHNLDLVPVYIMNRRFLMYRQKIEGIEIEEIAEGIWEMRRGVI